MKKDLSRTLVVKIQQNDYIVTFPNIGQIIDIESNKILYSNRQYSAMIKSGLATTNMALDLIEMTSCFTILIPALGKDLRLESIFDLDVISAKELVKAYKTVFLPWYLEWINVINEVEEKQEKTEDPQTA